jgi:hypothetical protein
MQAPMLQPGGPGAVPDHIMRMQLQTLQMQAMSLGVGGALPGALPGGSTPMMVCIHARCGSLLCRCQLARLRHAAHEVTASCPWHLLRGNANRCSASRALMGSVLLTCRRGPWPRLACRALAAALGQLASRCLAA